MRNRLAFSAAPERTIGRPDAITSIDQLLVRTFTTPAVDTIDADWDELFNEEFDVRELGVSPHDEDMLIREAGHAW